MNYTNKEMNDARLAHLSFDATMEDFYNESPTFEETLDALWDGQLEIGGNLEYDTE